MLILAETPVGYTLWRVTNEGVLDKNIKDLCAKYPTPEDAQSVLELHSFSQFTNAEEAISSLSSIANSEMNESLSNFLQQNVISAGIKEKIQVADATLGRAIETLGIKCVSPAGQDVPEIFRLIKNNITSLLPGVDEETFRQLELGIAHGIASTTLKFSPSKVDSMIVNSVNLLEELDKEVNNYGMRVREWYGWHFPELKNVTADNLLFAQIVLTMGTRDHANTTNFDQISLTPMMVEEIRKLANISIGTDLSDDDLCCIQDLAKQVIELIEFKSQISEYIRLRMRAIAPNLSELVGESVGSRLIAHAGSLNQLAKAAGSTIQVLGAEKALFRAKKEGKKTPKYGLLYHANLIAHATQQTKGKLSRSLAAKTALSSRVDAYADEPTNQIGLDDLSRLQDREKQLAGQQVSFSAARSAIREEPQKIVVEQVPNYKTDADFQIDEEQPKKRRKKRHHHKEEGEAAAE
ncbi:SnoRNA binding domain containing protein [Tritrichomonas foetus]|uniref:SnoRNA binding domain containing protein n=1 Tax=Tritrichomonas foetus TaxID=1144522 RepID=A0A1J4KU12_9EUKA|nr:SnoRNA binding domain containing protein [Tritrichomonas foetus]|eukprot:OHT13252.1 SnoRNA binding domain containing protein [Tritrichomonas foetus]